jgi:hypothetical protein
MKALEKRMKKEEKKREETGQPAAMPGPTEPAR